MRAYCFLLLVVCLIFEASSGLQKWEAIKASAEPEIQRNEVLQLLDRIKNNLSSQFEITVDPTVATTKNDFVKLEKLSSGDKITVLANSGVSAAWGIHHYFKYFCGWHFSWDTTRTGIKIQKLYYYALEKGILDEGLQMKDGSFFLMHVC